MLQKVSCNTKTEKEIIVPESLRDAADNFVLPVRYERSGSRSMARLYPWGTTD